MVPTQLHTKWLQLRAKISQVGLFHIPRHVLEKHRVSTQMDGFSDANERSYVVVFIFDLYIGMATQNLIYYAPNKKLLKLPRLELCGATCLLKREDALKFDILKLIFSVRNMKNIVFRYAANV